MQKSDKQLPLETIVRWVEQEKDMSLRGAAVDACIGRTDIPLETIKDWLWEDHYFCREAALNSCIGRSDVPQEFIARELGNSATQDYAAKAFLGRTDVPHKTIMRWLESESPAFRAAAFYANAGNCDIPLKYIIRELNEYDDSCELEINVEAALKNCEGRKDVSEALINNWFSSFDESFQLAALSACAGKKGNENNILARLQGFSSEISQMAMYVCSKNGINVPLYRESEPDREVYIKCLDDVVAVAEIPEDAQIRSALRVDSFRAYRTNKAIIKKIFGNTNGEKVGISACSDYSLYFTGDKIEIENFEYIHNIYGNGIVFYCPSDN